MSKDYFKKKKTAAIEKLHLPEGNNQVIVLETRFLDHLTSWDGVRRSPDPNGYQDEMPQIGYMVKDIKTGIVMVGRLNAKGCLAASDAEVDNDKITSGEHKIIGKYVCEETENGWERIENPAKTAQCDRILNQFLNAAGVPVNEGISVIDAVESVPGIGQVLQVECYNDPFPKVVDGKEVMSDNWKLKNFKPVKEAVTSMVEEVEDLDS